MDTHEGVGNSSKHRVEQEKSQDSSGSTGQQQRTRIQQLLHDHHFVRKALRILMIFVAFAVAGLVLYHSAQNLQNFPGSFYNLLSSSDTASPKDERLELKRLVEEAAMKDKTVIITTLNEAWAAPNSIFELFLESFRIGNGTEWLVNHLVVVALDQKAYVSCLKMHPHCYALRTDDGFDFSGEAYFMAPDYLKMMWRRIDFLRSVLDMGYNFIFTDADIMWFRDPFTRFIPETDFQIACDYFRGNPYDLNNAPNGGFTYVKSNYKTKEFYKFWYNSREKYPGKHDQDVLNSIKYDPFLTKIELQITFLDTAYFGGFCQPSKDLNRVCTMHANCCVGLDNKVHDLKIMLDDWRKYISNTSHVPSSWSVPQFCGAASFNSRHPSNKNEGH